MHLLLLLLLLLNELLALLQAGRARRVDGQLLLLLLLADHRRALMAQRQRAPRGALEVHAVEHLVGRVLRADDAHERGGRALEAQRLPAVARLVRLVHHSAPLLLVGGHLDVVRVGALVAVPQQQAANRAMFQCAAVANKRRLL